MSWKYKFPKENIYYETENGILYCGDCTKIMKTFPDNSIDAIITSPPYNVGIDYDNYEDTLEFDEYYMFIKLILQNFENILVDGGRFGINHLMDANKPIKHSPIMEIYCILKNFDKLNFFTLIDLYEKTHHRAKNTAWGSWLNPNSPYIYNAKEGILIGYKNNWKRNKKGKTDITKKEFMKLVTAIWDYFPQTKQLTKANFSESIPYNFIKINTFIGDIVLDPFMGSGTTAIVAEKLNRKWIGIELSKNYCEIIQNRLEGTI